METKTCFKCGKEKVLDDFYKHSQMKDGRVGKCKECNKKDVQENYDKNRLHYVEYEKERCQRPDRKQNAGEYQRKRRRKNPEKYLANQLAERAIKSGNLVKGVCEICGKEKVEAHHDDYYKPLSVRWLCRKHHLEYHGKKETETILWKY